MLWRNLKLQIKKEILLVGDSNTDLQTAKNANIQCFLVDYGYNGGKPVKELNPPKIIHSLLEVKDIIN